MSLPQYLWAAAALAVLAAASAYVVHDIRRICRNLTLYDTGLAQEQPLSLDHDCETHQAVTGEASTPFDWADEPVNDWATDVRTRTATCD